MIELNAGHRVGQRDPGVISMKTCLIVAVLVAAVPPLAATRQPARSIAITHARVLDVRTGAIRDDMTITIRSRTIATIEASAPPAGSEVVDARGRMVVPGLVDAHAHIADVAAAKTALLSGVTTARSAGVPMFADVALREMVKRGYLAGPDILAAGVHLRPDFESSSDILSDPRLFEFVLGLKSPDQIRRATQVNLDHGVDVIKTSATDRAGLPDTDPRHYLFDETQLRAVVETAARRGVPVETHAHGDEGAANAVRAGVRSIEHGTFLSEPTLRMMKEQNVWFVPTYSAMVDITDAGGDYDDPGLQIRGRFMLPQLRHTIREALKVGVRFATGADTEYGRRSVARVGGEVAYLVDAGLTPLAAIQAATMGGAELLGIAAKTGAVEPGREADLLVVDGNPLDRIWVLQNPLLVMSNGQVVYNALDPAK
jgi:imidazolonepropionase-like amidohydrolase